MRWLVRRFAHFWKITRWGWFVIYEMGWGFAFINLDFIIEHYGSESQKSYWKYVTHPRWGWKIWAIGALAILVLFVIEGSYRYEQERKAEEEKKTGELQARLDEEVAKRGRPEVVAVCTSKKYTSSFLGFVHSV